MEYGDKVELTKECKAIFDGLIASMTTEGRLKALEKYGGDDATALRGKWEG